MIFNFRKRGQAALEFLTTYGWAILVVLVMIAALSTFGVLNPDALLPERCSTSPEFSCNEYQVVRDDASVDLILSNQIGRTLSEVESISISIGGDNINQSSDACELHDDTQTPISAGGDVWISCESLDTDLWAPVGSKQSFNVNFRYLEQGRTFERTNSVDLYVMVQ